MEVRGTPKQASLNSLQTEVQDLKIISRARINAPTTIKLTPTCVALLGFLATQFIRSRAGGVLILIGSISIFLSQSQKRRSMNLSFLDFSINIFKY